MLIITYISVCILFLVSFLHVYWAFGGNWGQIVLFQLNQGKGVYTSRRNDIVHCIIIKYGAIILLQQAKFFILQFLMLLFKSVPGFV